MSILQGKSGHGVESNARGELYTYSTDRTEATALNTYGRLYVARVLNITPTAAAVRVFAVLDNTDTRILHVLEVGLTCAAAETVEVYLGGKATLTGGTTRAPKPMTLNAELNPTVGFVDGVDITGFDATANVMGLLSVDAARKMDRFFPPGRIEVPPNKTLYLKTVVSGAAIWAYIIFGYPMKSSEAGN